MNDGQEISAALKAFLETDLGQACIDRAASNQYLKNRIEAAFIAGWEAAKQPATNPPCAEEKP